MPCIFPKCLSRARHSDEARRTGNSLNKSKMRGLKFLSSFNKYLWSIYHMPAALGAVGIAANKTKFLLS